jgi:hypothetical protein
MSELRQRLLAAQEATSVAESKIQRIIDLVKQAKADEDARVPHQLRSRYNAARNRKIQAVKEIARLRALVATLETTHTGAASSSSSSAKVAFQPVKQAPVDERMAKMFTAKGMESQLAKEGLGARQAELPRLQIVPPALQNCKAWLEVNGVVPKIFHKQASDQHAVSVLLTHENVDIDAVTNDPHNVARAMIQYFERLPAAIVPAKLLPLFEALFTADMDSQEVPQQLHEAVNQIESPAFDTLSFLFGYLSELAELHSETRMEAADLADIFAPVIFRSNSRINKATEGMIRYYSFVFAKKKAGRTFGIVKQKGAVANTDHDLTGYVDNRFDYMARGYS